MKKKMNSACTARPVGRLVYQYHNGSLSKEKTLKFLNHASKCPKCGSTLRRLDWITKTMRQNPSAYFPGVGAESRMLTIIKESSDQTKHHNDDAPFGYVLPKIDDWLTRVLQKKLSNKQESAQEAIKSLAQGLFVASVASSLRKRARSNPMRKK